MSIQDWHTLVRLEYQKCSLPTQVDDRLQRDIFMIGLNETFKKFLSDIISQENVSTWVHLFPKLFLRLGTLRLGSKRNQPSPNSIWKKWFTKLLLMSTKHHTTQPDVTLLLSLVCLIFPLASGVGRLHIQPDVTALQQMLFFMGVAKGVIGSKYVAPPLQRITYQKYLRPKLSTHIQHVSWITRERSPSCEFCS